MLWPTVLIASLLFWIGNAAARKTTQTPKRVAFMLAALILAVPGLTFAAYYTKLLGEPVWLYRFRAIPGTELTAGGVGLLAGFIHQTRHNYAFLKKQLRVFTVPAILAVIVVAPYAKPLIRPLNKTQLTEQWKDGVCLQSTPSTCGPASAATIASSLGRRVTEAELAEESFTYVGGTENWYLVRALRKRGFETEFKPTAPNAEVFPTSAIAGVRLPQGTGHFIALIAQENSTYIASDPLIGRFTATLAELKSNYQFTGFFLIIK